MIDLLIKPSIYFIILFISFSCSTPQNINEQTIAIETTEYVDTISSPIVFQQELINSARLINHADGTPMIQYYDYDFIYINEVFEKDFRFPYSIYFLGSTDSAKLFLIPKILGFQYLRSCVPPTDEGSLWTGYFYNYFGFLDEKGMFQYFNKQDSKGNIVIKLNEKGIAEWTVAAYSKESEFREMIVYETSLSEPMIISIESSDTITIIDRGSVKVIPTTQNVQLFYQVNEFGEIQKQIHLNQIPNAHINDIEISHDKILACGYTKVSFYDSTRAQQLDSLSLVLMCTDTANNLIWQKIMSAKYDNYFTDIQKTYDHHFLALGTYQSAFKLELSNEKCIEIPEPKMEKAYIILKFDENGNVIKYLTFEASWYDYICHFESDNFGNIHICGSFNKSIRVNNSNDTLEIDGYGSEDIFYLKFDKEFKLTKHFKFGYKGNNRYEGGYVTKEGSFITLLSADGGWGKVFVNETEYVTKYDTGFLLKF